MFDRNSRAKTCQLWIVQQLGGAPDGIATQDGTAVEVWREVLQRTGIRQCDMRLDDNTPAKEGDDPQQERRRLALVHGMRVGEIRGVEQGELWKRRANQESRQRGWGVSGGMACSEGTSGKWMLAPAVQAGTSYGEAHTMWTLRGTRAAATGPATKPAQGGG